jgi:hypothetical protein
VILNKIIRKVSDMARELKDAIAAELLIKG